MHSTHATSDKHVADWAGDIKGSTVGRPSSQAETEVGKSLGQLTETEVYKQEPWSTVHSVLCCIMKWIGVGAYNLDLWLDDFDKRGSLSQAVILQLQEDPDLQPHLQLVARIAEELLRMCEDEGRGKISDNLHDPEHGILILRITVSSQPQPVWMTPGH